MKNLFLIALLCMLLVSCSIKIDDISYGNDACHYCSMTIVTPAHAAQVVTEKGKNYKFDATECMINYLAENDNESNMRHILSANYLNPSEMINSKESTFLISESIPSPMGANLSVFKNDEEANEILDQIDSGDLLNWDEVKNRIRNTTIYH